MIIAAFSGSSSRGAEERWQPGTASDPRGVHTRRRSRNAAWPHKYLHACTGAAQVTQAQRQRPYHGPKSPH